MLHNIEPMKYDITWSKEEVRAGDHLICLKGSKILVKIADGQVSVPVYGKQSFKSTYEYLFKIDDQRFFRVEDEVEEEGYSYCRLNDIRNLQPQWLVCGIATGHQLASWYQVNTYCGRCGKKLSKSDHERALVCDECHNIVYPKICPGVIVAVTNGDRIVLTKNPGRSTFALISGFTETGEPIEDTVKREVMEEVGLKVKNLRFYKSQPWVFSDTLLCGFYCEVDGDTTLRVDHHELDDAKWVSRDECPEGTNSLSLTQEMISNFKKGLV